MRKLIAVIIGFLGIPHLGLANYEACQAQLSVKFNIDKNETGMLCALDSVFIQQCMEEQGDLLKVTDFSALAEICTELLNQSQKRQNPTDLQNLRVKQF